MFKIGKIVQYINEVFKLIFRDKAHKDFYEKKLMENEKYNTSDVYYKALIYTLRSL